MARDREADLATLRAVQAAAEGGDFATATRLAAAALDSGLEHPLPFNVLALGLEHDGRIAEAAALLERAVGRFPDDVGIRNALGLCLLRLERPVEAARQFEALVAREPRLPFAHASHGKALLAGGGLAKAQASFRRALELHAGQGVALAGLAQIAVRRGLYREARGWAERALAVMPGFPDAIMSLAAAELGEGTPAQAVARLDALLGDARLGALERAYANGLRGDALDAEDRPADAFAAYSLCNSGLRELYAPRFAGAQTALAYVEAMTAYFADARSADWQRPGVADEASPARGHVFVLGFPRSGTTLLEVVLEGHPRAVSVGENELLIDGVREFMADAAGLERLAAAGPDALRRLQAAYWARAAATGAELDGAVFIDKHPLNTLKLPLIARLFPRARIVFAYRDPRDVVLSCFRRRFQMSAPMYELLTLEGAARFYDAVMTLAQRLDLVLPTEVRRLCYETLVGDFDAEMQSVCTFLGLEWTPAMRDFGARTRERASATPSTAQLARGLDAGGIGAWRRYGAQMAPALPLLAPWVARLGYAP